MVNTELLNNLIAQSFHDHESGLVMFDREKFAELIIRECMDICDAGTSTQSTSGGAAIMIGQHFGVKPYAR